MRKAYLGVGLAATLASGAALLAYRHHVQPRDSHAGPDTVGQDAGGVPSPSEEGCPPPQEGPGGGPETDGALPGGAVVTLAELADFERQLAAEAERLARDVEPGGVALVSPQLRRLVRRNAEAALAYARKRIDGARSLYAERDVAGVLILLAEMGHTEVINWFYPFAKRSVIPPWWMEMVLEAYGDPELYKDWMLHRGRPSNVVIPYPTLEWVEEHGIGGHRRQWVEGMVAGGDAFLRQCIAGESHQHYALLYVLFHRRVDLLPDLQEAADAFLAAPFGPGSDGWVRRVLLMQRLGGELSETEQDALKERGYIP